MGNRAYLFASDDSELFESNNTLPSFWLAMLDAPLVRSYEPILRGIFAHYEAVDAGEVGQDDFTEPDSLVVGTQTALANLATARPHLEASFPELTALFDDFTDHVETFGGPTLTLHLDQMANFYETTDEFIETLQDEVLAWTTGVGLGTGHFRPTDPVGTGTGFHRYDDATFSERSAAYRHFAEQRYMEAVRNQPRNIQATGKSILARIALFALCPVFTWIATVGYRAEGWSGMVIFLIASNIIFYIWIGYDLWEHIVDCYRRRRGRAD